MEWTFDHGDGPQPVTLPHCWKDLPPAWTGPALYRTRVFVPAERPWLQFGGVSYEAVVRVDGRDVLTHRGIWDAFGVNLRPWSGQEVELEVEVTKNGGSKFPVRDVLSGFLPFVFHTFGGICGSVEWVEGPLTPLPSAAATVRVEGNRLLWNGKPTFLRGVLSWGWYPELGHPNPDEQTIRDEVRKVRSLGFNLIKFCLWIPPHRYCEILEEEGMLGWLELPLWDPTSDPVRLQEMADEVLRIVDQYRHHPALQIWTLGCELSTATSAEFRKGLFDEVKARIGDRLLKDNSGGAEMYGGDLREFGDFQDFHPYCDLPHYPLVLDGLNANEPILLGEFNDLDVHRDLPRLRKEDPYWGSSDPTLNPMGVRWQIDLPNFLRKTPFAFDEARSARLLESSRSLSLFVRKSVHEMVRLRPKFAGGVITGIRDTPVSTAGLFDDWGEPRFSREELQGWNSDVVIVRAPFSNPLWRNGGNQPGIRSLGCVFEGAPVDVRLLLSGAANEEVEVLLDGSRQVVQLSESGWTHVQFAPVPVGCHRLIARGNGVCNEWLIHCFRRVPMLEGLKALTGEGTFMRPFWREAAYEFSKEFWEGSGLIDAWDVWQDVSPDRAIDPAFLAANWPEAEVEAMINRVDTRTYEELPILVRLRGARDGTQFVSTLRMDGGLGVQPFGFRGNPAAHGVCGWLQHSLSG